MEKSAQRYHVHSLPKFVTQFPAPLPVQETFVPIGQRQLFLKLATCGVT